MATLHITLLTKPSESLECGNGVFCRGIPTQVIRLGKAAFVVHLIQPLSHWLGQALSCNQLKDAMHILCLEESASYSANRRTLNRKPNQHLALVRSWAIPLPSILSSTPQTHKPQTLPPKPDT